MRQFAVIGLGRFGYSVAKTLAGKKHQVIAIDSDEAIVQKISDFVAQAVCLDSTDMEALQSVSIKEVDVAICAIGTNLEASILTTLNLKELGIKNIVCKARNETQKMLLEKIGATKVVLPENEMGIRLANSLMTSQVVEQISLSEYASVAEVLPPQELVGKSLGEVNIRAQYGLNVISIKEGNDVNMHPKADDIIKKDAILVVIGSDLDIDKFKKKHK
ncbi:MAG: TrkA family potassium uptake protein [Candidatus Omnitrophica bacterium]|nr:TrkA family potassium uptake protein [Candidatus Omnitrophota bacterium]